MTVPAGASMTGASMSAHGCRASNGLNRSYRATVVPGITRMTRESAQRRFWLQPLRLNRV